MAWLQLDWSLTILDKNEHDRRSDREDEASLQFVFVTIIDGTVNVHGHSTGNLFPSLPFGEGGVGWPGGIPFGTVRSGANIPSARNPYLGFVARAVEQDNSSTSMRNDDNNDFYDAIELAAQQNIDSGGIPTVDVLWSAGNAVALSDNFGDDDDRIGVSARVFPNYGVEVASEVARESDWPAGGAIIPGTERTFELVFQEEGAVYQFNGELRMVTDDPAPSSP